MLRRFASHTYFHTVFRVYLCVSDRDATVQLFDKTFVRLLCAYFGFSYNHMGKSVTKHSAISFDGIFFVHLSNSPVPAVFTRMCSGCFIFHFSTLRSVQRTQKILKSIKIELNLKFLTFVISSCNGISLLFFRIAGHWDAAWKKKLEWAILRALMFVGSTSCSFNFGDSIFAIDSTIK